MSDALAAKIDLALTKYPDFPKAGILFRDIAPVLADTALFREVTNAFAAQISQSGAQAIIGIESRGFIFGSAAAVVSGRPFMLARKAGKLPGMVEDVSYALEYGSATIEMQKKPLEHCRSVVLIDDVIATGGTLLATAQLVRRFGIEIKTVLALASIEFLEGRQKLAQAGLNVQVLCPLK